MIKKLLFVMLTGLMSMSAWAVNPPSNPGNPGNPGNPDPACVGKTLGSGETTRTIQVGGQSRTYILRVPGSYDGTKPVPLLLDFHALLTSASYQRDNSGTLEVAEREGFIVAYPQGIDNAWNIGPCCTRSRAVDDIGFAKAIVEQVASQGCIDRKRVYATGYSNGGGMAYTLACKAADTFAAIAPAAFDLIQEVACTPSRPVSVFSARGRLDTIVPYNGGRSTPPTSYPLDPIHFLGAEGTFQKWAQINGCTGSPTRLNSSCDGYRNCNGGTEVVLCTARLGTHRAWDATESWNYLKNHRLP